MTKYEINILRQALLMVERREVKILKSLPQKKAEFSDEFKANIEKMAKRTTSFAYQATKTVPRKIAVVFAAAVVTFCLMMSIAAIRKPVVNFFVNVYEEFISIFVKEDEEVKRPETIEEVYLPTYMIDNYSKISFQKVELRVETVWMNFDISDVIILSQDLLQTDFKSYIDNKDADYIKADFGNDVYYMIKNNQRFVIWASDYYMFSFVCSDKIELSEIEKIIKSMSSETVD